MPEKIVLTVPALLLQPGDRTHGYVVSQMKSFPDGTKEFKLVVPQTTHYMTVTVLEKDLKDISFPLTYRGDDYSPNARNAALGLTPVPPKEYVAPEPVAVYKAGTLMKDVKHFDRSMKIALHCPTHPENVAFSKDPYCSSWFWADGEKSCDCLHNVNDYVVHYDYKPTRNR